MTNTKKTYRQAVLEKYISATYGDSHADNSNLIGGTDLWRQFKFFKYNYLQHLPQDKQTQILELGPGMSQFLLFLKDQGYHNITGVDGSPEVAERAAALGLSVETTQNFSGYLFNAAKKFNVVVGNDILEHFTKQELYELLLATHSVLLPNGKLVAKVPNMACILGATSRNWDFTHEVGLTENSLRQVLYAAGFSKVKFFEPNLYCFYTNPLNYIGKFFYLIQKWIQIALHKLNGNFGVSIVSNNLIVVAEK